MTATPMLDKVRNYAKRWGVKTSATHVMELYPPGHVPWTHDGPGIFAIDWPTRTVIEPLATKPKRGLVASDSDAWYLIHELSHVLVNVDPDEVDEVQSAMLALDFYAGRYLGFSDDEWEKWMADFTLDLGTLEEHGYTRPDHYISLEWCEVDRATQERMLHGSLKLAAEAGLLSPQGDPTFNRSAWMPASMQIERKAMPLAMAKSPRKR